MERPSEQAVLVDPLCDPTDLWYSREDLAAFKAHRNQACRMLAQVGFNVTTLALSWGLEHSFCDELSRERKNRKQEAWDVVLEEQDYQLENDEFSWERLAELYQDITRESQLQAYQQARRYQLELLNEEQAYQLYDTWEHAASLQKVQRHSLDREHHGMIPSPYGIAQ